MPRHEAYDDVGAATAIRSLDKSAIIEMKSSFQWTVGYSDGREKGKTDCAHCVSGGSFRIPPLPCIIPVLEFH